MWGGEGDSSGASGKPRHGGSDARLFTLPANCCCHAEGCCCCGGCSSLLGGFPRAWLSPPLPPPPPRPLSPHPSLLSPLSFPSAASSFPLAPLSLGSSAPVPTTRRPPRPSLPPPPPGRAFPRRPPRGCPSGGASAASCSLRALSWPRRGAPGAGQRWARLPRRARRRSPDRDRDRSSAAGPGQPPRVSPAVTGTCWGTVSPPRPLSSFRPGRGGQVAVPPGGCPCPTAACVGARPLTHSLSAFPRRFRPRRRGRGITGSRGSSGAVAR